MRKKSATLLIMLFPLDIKQRLELEYITQNLIERWVTIKQ